MRFRTNYTVKESQGEIFTEPSKTDGSQYVSISEVVKRYIRGDSMDLHDYTLDNPMDCKDKFDVMDVYIHEKNKANLKKKPQEDKKPEVKEQPKEAEA